jgi:hypothetical protein
VRKATSGKQSNMAVLAPSVRQDGIADEKTGNWSGQTPCCGKTVSIDKVGDLKVAYYYRACPECGCLVEIAFTKRKGEVTVAVEIVNPRYLWGVNSERQRLAREKIKGVEND